MDRKKILRWVKVVLLVYCGIGIAWYYGQDRIILHPVVLPKDKPYTFSQPFTELNLPYDAQTNLNVVEFRATDRPADSAAKGVVLYFPDGKGNIATNAGDLSGFASRGYEAWLMDYPGFGKSTGVFTEKEAYTYALEFYKLARSRWKPSQIVIYGKGLGTGIAAELASVRNCRRLILQDPYYSMTSRFRTWFFLYPVRIMLHYRFPVDEYLPAVTDPITLIGGDSRLKTLLKPGDEYIKEEYLKNEDPAQIGTTR
jgi:pimeloyl-ACP methyl ester carboxylesterase